MPSRVLCAAIITRLRTTSTRHGRNNRPASAIIDHPIAQITCQTINA
jgi:hypothetical protein